MQFANDITPLTLASTAELREYSKEENLSRWTKSGIQMELDSRIPNGWIMCADGQIRQVIER